MKNTRILINTSNILYLISIFFAFLSLGTKKMLAEQMPNGIAGHENIVNSATPKDQWQPVSVNNVNRKRYNPEEYHDANGSIYITHEIYNSPSNYQKRPRISRVQQYDYEEQPQKNNPSPTKPIPDKSNDLTAQQLPEKKVQKIHKSKKNGSKTKVKNKKHKKKYYAKDCIVCKDTDKYGSIGRQKFDLAIFGAGGIMYSVMSNIYAGDVTKNESQLDTFTISGLMYRFGGGIKLNAGGERKFFFLNASTYGNLSQSSSESFDSKSIGLDVRSQIGVGYVLGSPKSKWFYAAKLIGLDFSYLDLVPMLSNSATMQSAGLSSVKGNLQQIAIGIYTGVRFTEHVGDRHIFSQGIAFSIGPSFFTGNHGYSGNNVGLGLNFMLYFEHNIKMTDNVYFRWFIESDTSLNVSFTPRIPIIPDAVENGLTGVQDLIAKVEQLTAIESKDANGNAIQGSVSGLLGTFQAAIKNVGFLIKYSQYRIDELVKNMSSSAQIGTAQGIGKLLDELTNFGKLLTEQIDKDLISKILEQGFGKDTSIGGTLQDVFKTLDNISKIIENMPKIIEDFRKNFEGGLDNLVTDAKGEIQKMINDLLSSVQGDAEKLIDGFSYIIDAFTSGHFADGGLRASEDYMIGGLKSSFDMYDEPLAIQGPTGVVHLFEKAQENIDLMKKPVKELLDVPSNSQNAISNPLYQKNYYQLIEDVKSSPTPESVRILNEATSKMYEMMIKNVPIKEILNHISQNNLNLGAWNSNLQSANLDNPAYTQTYDALLKEIYSFRSYGSSDDQIKHHQDLLNAFETATTHIFGKDAPSVVEFMKNIESISKEPDVQESIQKFLDQVSGLNTSAHDLINLFDPHKVQFTTPGFSAGITLYPRVNVGVGLYFKF